MERTLTLGDEPDAGRAARRFARGCLRGTPLEHRSDDAELIVSELVTNAALHAGPPITVRVTVGDEVRLAVEDSSSTPPVRPLHGPEVMTGRGLLLVGSLSDRWGVDGRADGKVVWADLGPSAPAEPPAEQVGIEAPELEGLPDPLDHPERYPRAATPTDEPRYTIELGDVSTDLLVAAKAHVDNVVREFALVSGGAASGQTAAVSRHLAELIDTVTTRFSEARQIIKQQALASVEAGRERTHLVLSLPASAVKAGCDYLAALDEVDAYARAARLLTLATPPQHRAFRKWYVNSLMHQLEAKQRGEPGPAPEPFEQFLLDEFEVVATAHRATDRAARLQQVTAALAGASTVGEVAKVVVSQGVEALGASGGALVMPLDDKHLDVLAEVHYGNALVDYLRTGALEANTPSVVALRTGEAVWVDAFESSNPGYTEIRALEPDTVSMCAVPLALAGRVLAVMRLSFNVPHLFDEEEREFVLAFAAQTVQALDRAELYEAERQARADAETAAGRLSRLNQVTAELAAASEVDQIAHIVAHEAHDTLGATVSALCLVEDAHTLRTVELEGVQPGTRQRWQRFPIDADLPASEAIRTNAPVVVRSRSEMEARYPLLAGASPREQSVICVPMSVGRRPLGVLSLSFAPPYTVNRDLVEMLATLGHQCALAIERAHLLAAERAARQRSSFLADSTAKVAASLDPEETLSSLTALLVPHLADWAAVYLTDQAGHVVTATCRHRDPAVTERMKQLQVASPLDSEAVGDLADVMRSGQRLVVPALSDEQRRRFAELFSSASSGEEFSPSTAMALPFVRAERILGALVLGRLDEPAYTDADLLLASELADRAAVALDNAARFGREREVALTLQRSLLPQVLPRVRGLALAWRYFPGAAGTHVGGDWYDVIPLGSDRVALVIGDVMGRGLQAAAVMGQLRATARAHVAGDLGPAEVLTRVDAELMRLEQEQIATVLLGILDLGSGTLTAASAGHLPPLVRTHEGDVFYLDVAPGPPLGTGSGAYSDSRVRLDAGATVLLYTDGLVEDRRLSIDQGLATLAEAARAAHEPEQLCDRALVALGRDTEHDDDTAMLAVHLPRD